MILLTAGALLIASCELISSDQSELVCSTDAVPGAIQPLALGNYWTYEKLNQDGSLRSKQTIRVANQFQLKDNGTTMLASEIDPDSLRENRPHLLMSNFPDGLYHVGRIADGDTIQSNVLYRQYPASTGTVFMGGWPIQDDEQIRIIEYEYTILSTDSLIVTPAGSFRTYVYRRVFDLQDVATLYTEDQFYAPGIGRVAETFSSREGTFRELLSDYQLCR